MEKELKPAEKNPWYVLATVYGEQTSSLVPVDPEPDELDELARYFDPNLHKKNRRIWNGWYGNCLTIEVRAELAKRSGCAPDEFSQLTDDELQDVRAAFDERLGQNVEIPDPALPIDFSNTRFPHSVHFNEFVFPVETRFKHVVFVGSGSFHSSTFKGIASFSEASFICDACFSSAAFDREAFFRETSFHDKCLFQSAVFSARTWFDSAKFKGPADFMYARFEDRALFRGTAFLDSAAFFQVSFDAKVWFGGAEFESVANFDASDFSERAYFSKTRFGPSCRASFRDASFQRPVSFSETQFIGWYPEFSGAVLPDEIEFSATDKAVRETKDSGGKRYKTDHFWPDHKNIENPADIQRSRRACAIIRHALGRQGLPEDEHFFFRQEMDFAGRSGSWLERLPYRLFAAISMYGYSIARPAVALFLLFLLPALVFKAAFELDCISNGLTHFCVTFGQPFGLSFANTFGFLGFHRLYFGGFLGSAPGWVQVLSGVQTVLGVILLFFLGLGLRTRFRLR
ncbi:MAG: pentapeptide repeat-containing protein [Pseudomonadota bacterium]|nr:pentapeptide repeat-containing protein [Pseudomonadota bacterium]